MSKRMRMTANARKSVRPRQSKKLYHKGLRPHPINSFIQGKGLFRGGVQA